MEARYAKLKELLSNEETAKRLLNLSPEDASRVLDAEYGIQFTVDELNDIMRGIQDSIKERENGELTANELDCVSGGGKGSESYEFGKSIGRTTTIIVACCVFFGW